MKKLIVLISLISVIAISFVSCFGYSPSRKKQYIRQLERKDFDVVISCESEEELLEEEDKLNKEIRFFAAEPFLVDLTDYVEMIKRDESNYECKIYEFVTSFQAEKYAHHYVDTRAQYDKNMVAQNGRVVIVTDSPTVMDIINLEFK